MVVHTTNILILPLMLLAWLIDVYLLLAGVRLVLGRMKGTGPAHACEWLQQVTDPVPAVVCHWLEQRCARPAPPWLPWLVVLIGGLLARHLAVWLAFSMPRL